MESACFQIRKKAESPRFTPLRILDTPETWTPSHNEALATNQQATRIKTTKRPIQRHMKLLLWTFIKFFWEPCNLLTYIAISKSSAAPRHTLRLYGSERTWPSLETFLDFTWVICRLKPKKYKTSRWMFIRYTKYCRVALATSRFIH